MPVNNLTSMGIADLQNLLEKREVSALEILDNHLAQIKSHDKEIGAFICLTEELATKQAKAVDHAISKKEKLGPLAGIPTALKDNVCLSGYPTTCASKMLENFIAPYEATVVKHLFDAGAVCIGKTNLDEFAMGSSTENSCFHPTRNPWNTDKVPGGSSGGSAASVAAGFSVVATGSDTGGSIRLPASFCGVVGMKPTYGLVSRYGLVAFASSLDQIGPFARSVEDLQVALSVIAKPDPKDSTSIKNPILNQPHSDAQLKEVGFDLQLSKFSPEEHVKGFRVGVIKELMGEGIDPDIAEAVKATCAIFEKLGAKVEEVSIPLSKLVLPVYYLIATAETSANLARYDGVRYGMREVESDVLSMYLNTRKQGFGSEVKRRIMLGTYALSSGYYDAYYKKAGQVRRLLKNDFDRIFKSCDLLISPNAPFKAFNVNEKTSDPLQMYLTDIATIPANLAGLPGISVPAGMSEDGLPIGIQLIGAPLSDSILLRAAYAYEKSAKHNNRLSPLLSRTA